MGHLTKCEWGAVPASLSDAKGCLAVDVQEYATAQDMMQSTCLKAGYAHTLGFYEVGDGGAAYYTIADQGEPNGMDILRCAKGLVAELVPGEWVTPEQFGAKGDGVTNDTDNINRALQKSSVLSIQQKEYFIENVIVPDKRNISNITFATNGNGITVQSSHTIIEACKIISNNDEPTTDNTIGITVDSGFLNGFIHITDTFIQNFGIAVLCNAGTIIDMCKFYNNYKAVVSNATDLKISNTISRGKIGIEAQPGLIATAYHHWCWYQTGEVNEYSGSYMFKPLSYGFYYINGCFADTVETVIKREGVAATSVFCINGLFYYLNPSVPNNIVNDKLSFTTPVLSNMYDSGRIILDSSTFQFDGYGPGAPDFFPQPLNASRLLIGNVIAYGTAGWVNSLGITQLTLGNTDFTGNWTGYVNETPYEISIFALGELTKNANENTYLGSISINKEFSQRFPVSAVFIGQNNTYLPIVAYIANNAIELYTTYALSNGTIRISGSCLNSQ